MQQLCSQYVLAVVAVVSVGEETALDVVVAEVAEETTAVDVVVATVAVVAVVGECQK